MKGTVSEKGQVTIPKPLRDSLALTPGTTLEFEEREGLLIGRRVADHDPLSRLVGLVRRVDVDEALADLRGPAWHAELDEGPRGHRRR
ncbi:MAG: AbrB/MazE/SpoVT family DNA-binding domain-containing protein [Vicinamibacteraceae bacterium]|nr:AbrB/MazE/SpoVT family DNA-binding domain-containing protein [Vicinamibacteraceae bacterium]